jgi:hypothetical protein
MSNHRIQFFTSSGIYLGQWAKDGFSFFCGPNALAVAPYDMTVYVTGNYEDSVFVYGVSAALPGQWGSEGSQPGQFTDPKGVAVAPNGKAVYVVDSGNNRIQAFCVVPATAARERVASPIAGTPASMPIATPVAIRSDVRNDSDNANRTTSAADLSLLDFLPTQEQVPDGLVLADEAERSKQDVAAALGGTDEATQLLDDWGWSGNAFRDFVLPQDAEPGPGGTTFLNVSVHRFADAESAANALVFFSDQVVISQGLEDVEAPAIGESARLLVGAPDGVPLTILYVQDGPIMYRMGGSSANTDSDPTGDVLAVAQAIIPGQS